MIQNDPHLILAREDCQQRVAALRKRIVRDWGHDPERVKAGLNEQIDLVQARGSPLDIVFHSGLHVARSLVMLHLPGDALKRLDALLRAPGDSANSGRQPDQDGASHGF